MFLSCQQDLTYLHPPLQAALGGKSSPSADDINKILSSGANIGSGSMGPCLSTACARTHVQACSEGQTGGRAGHCFRTRETVLLLLIWTSCSSRAHHFLKLASDGPAHSAMGNKLRRSCQQCCSVHQRLHCLKSFDMLCSCTLGPLMSNTQCPPHAWLALQLSSRFGCTAVLHRQADSGRPVTGVQDAVTMKYNTCSAVGIGMVPSSAKLSHVATAIRLDAFSVQWALRQTASVWTS